MAATRPAQRLIVLGSTGSIGASTLEVVSHFASMPPSANAPQFQIVGLAAGRNAPSLAKQARDFQVPNLALLDAEAAKQLKGFDSVRSGPDAALQLIRDIARPGDLVVAAMVGFAGLAPTLLALERGCTVALANKETLVAAGSLMTAAAKRAGTLLLPVDSEHSGLAQCLRSGAREEITRVVLTASGGPFRTWSHERTAGATVEEALNHPTWKMGPKVTIDSATLMNKALEIIEAHWLFDLPAERIDAIVHPQSVVHAMIEYADGSVIAQMSPPDMKLPIQAALCWPQRHPGVAKKLDWSALKALDFHAIDHERFPAVELARQVIRQGGTAGVTLNAANEVAVEAFLNHEIRFGEIGRIIQRTMKALPARPIQHLSDVEAADREARRHARTLVDAAANLQAKRPEAARPR
ncbi:MAG: 1-deoxy-D-xylulose-5-phosphate reductoisomerase [Planctomycetes bacterium]|nr:1-deoxy-D-xylulose-5-phosphate reductoisomerase [Planctomycetota bacterium]